MRLEETLRKMRDENSDEKFYPLVESMKRRADKGLLEGVKSADIEFYLKKMENEKIHQEQVEINLKQELFELNEAVEKYGYMDIESWSLEELEAGILYEFCNDLEMLNEWGYDDYDDMDSEEERKKKKIRKGINTGVIGATGAGASALTMNVIGNHQLSRNIETAQNDAVDKLKKKYLTDNGGMTDAAKEIYNKEYESYLNTHGKNFEGGINGEIAKKYATNHATSKVNALTDQNAIDAIKKKAEDDTREAFGNPILNVGKQFHNNVLKPVGRAVAAPFKHMAGAVETVNPGLAALGGGLAALGVVGLGIGAYKLIQHLRRKRQAQLSESISDTQLFSMKLTNILKESINSLSNEGIEFLLENGCDDTKEILSLFKKQSQTLDESVTFIDNAGNLKTMLTPDYVKDQHEYHTETQIEKYEKKKKKRDYKLISEEIDIDSLKKLSEMSFEEILAEDL